MKAMPAGEFKAKCLRVMEEVRKYRTPVVITKKGRQIAKLVPIDAPAVDVFGCMASTARIVGDIEAPVVDAGLWEASQGAGRDGKHGPRLRGDEPDRPRSTPAKGARAKSNTRQAPGKSGRSGRVGRAGATP